MLPCLLTLFQILHSQILHSSKLKEFADDNFKFDKSGGKFSKRVENTVGKGEIPRLERFLLFPQYFQMAFSQDTYKPGLVWERDKSGLPRDGKMGRFQCFVKVLRTSIKEHPDLSLIGSILFLTEFSSESPPPPPPPQSSIG